MARIKEEPFVGVGLDLFSVTRPFGFESYEYDVHNLVVGRWYKTGLVGLAGMPIALLAILRAAWTAISRVRSPVEVGGRSCEGDSRSERGHDCTDWQHPGREQKPDVTYPHPTANVGAAPGLAARDIGFKCGERSCADRSAPLTTGAQGSDPWIAIRKSRTTRSRPPRPPSSHRTPCA